MQQHVPRPWGGHNMGQGVSLYAIVRLLFTLYYYTLFARILLSWFRLSGDNAITRFVYDMTEPVMRPFRQILPPVGGLDLSPLLLFALLGVIQRVVLDAIWRLGF